MRLLPCTSHTRAGVSTGMGQYTAAVIDALRVNTVQIEEEVAFLANF
jgi:hypothetical protein